MAKVARGGATHLHRGLPDEIVFWEILVSLPPNSLLRCRSVCRAWRRVTSDREFLLAHHARQPSLPIVSGYEHTLWTCRNILAFDHRAAAGAQLQPVARLDERFSLEASCDGLLILSKLSKFGSRLSVCNPATREFATLGQPCGSSLLGMYPHRPTGEYRLLLRRSSHSHSVLGHVLPRGETGCYVCALRSDQPSRYIAGPDIASAAHRQAPAFVRDSLHWYTTRKKIGMVLVFDTIAELFRQIRSPVVSSTTTTNSYTFQMEETLGISSYDDGPKIVHIWVLQNYQDEAWEHKYQIELPIAEMRGELGSRDDNWLTCVAAVVDGDALLMLRYGRWMFYVDTHGKLVDRLQHDSQHFYPCEFRLKQNLVRHTFFTALEGYGVNNSPFV